MKDLDHHKKIAVLIDADNAQYAKVQAILDEISAHGHIVQQTGQINILALYFSKQKCTKSLI